MVGSKKRITPGTVAEKFVTKWVSMLRIRVPKTWSEEKVDEAHAAVSELIEDMVSDEPRGKVVANTKVCGFYCSCKSDATSFNAQHGLIERSIRSRCSRHG